MMDMPEKTGMEILDQRDAAAIGEPEAVDAGPTPDSGINSAGAADAVATAAGDAAAVDMGHPGRSESGVGDIAFIVVFMLAVLFTMKILGRRGGKRVPGSDSTFAQKAAELRAKYVEIEAAQNAAAAAASIEGKPAAAGGAVRGGRSGTMTEEVASLRERVATLERLMRRSEARLADLERLESVSTSAGRNAAARDGLRIAMLSESKEGVGVAIGANSGANAGVPAAVEAKPMMVLSPPPPLGAVRSEILRLAKAGASETDIAARIGVPESHVRLVTGMSRAAV